ncbi:MAG: cell division protein ZipA C-terminal FtsZ-binding domain-containing protein [Bdellovibrio bacteriovorus]
MDADTVRLILIVVGAVFILALYLWERRRDSADDQDDEQDYDDAQPSHHAGHAKREPQLGGLAGGDPDGAGLEGAAVPGRDRPDDDEAPLLIQLSVAKRTGSFPGPDILEVAESCGLRPGDMDIFHCLDEFEDGTRIYFSMANMVKPGTFPFDAMDDFSTPGMMLFAQLEGYPEDLTVLEEMIATARKLANSLGGDVLDDTRRPLTVRKEEEMRNAVLTHEARRARSLRR